MKDLPMTPEARREHFETWLASMDVYLDRLKSEVWFPMGYTLDSLVPLEAWLLDRYPDINAAKADMSGGIKDAGVYLGEVMRKVGGGKWRLDEQEDSVFFGLLVLDGIGRGHTACPITLASASTSRRRGDYLISVARHLTGA